MQRHHETEALPSIPPETTVPTALSHHHTHTQTQSSTLQSYTLKQLIGLYNESSDSLSTEFNRVRTCKLLRIRPTTLVPWNQSENEPRPHITGYHITNTLKKHELTKDFHSLWKIHRPSSFHDYIGIEISYDANHDGEWQWPKTLVIENQTYFLIVTNLNPSEFILTDVVQGINPELIQHIANRITCGSDSQTASIFGPLPCSRVNCCSYLIVAPTLKLLPSALLWNYRSETTSSKMRAIFMDKTICSKCHLAGHKSVNCSLTDEHIKFLKDVSPSYEKGEQKKLESSRRVHTVPQSSTQSKQRPTSSPLSIHPTYRQVVTNSVAVGNSLRRTSQSSSSTIAHPTNSPQQSEPRTLQLSSNAQQGLATGNNGVSPPETIRNSSAAPPRESSTIASSTVQAPQAEPTNVPSPLSPQSTHPVVEGVNLVSDIQTQPSTPLSQTSTLSEEDTLTLTTARVARSRGAAAKKGK